MIKRGFLGTIQTGTVLIEFIGVTLVTLLLVSGVYSIIAVAQVTRTIDNIVERSISELNLKPYRASYLNTNTKLVVDYTGLDAELKKIIAVAASHYSEFTKQYSIDAEPYIESRYAVLKIDSQTGKKLGQLEISQKYTNGLANRFSASLNDRTSLSSLLTRKLEVDNELKPIFSGVKISNYLKNRNYNQYYLPAVVLIALRIVVKPKNGMTRLLASLFTAEGVYYSTKVARLRGLIAL